MRYLVPLLLVCGLGCETIVDVDPPAHTPQLVAQGVFAPDSEWAVRVMQTVPFTAEEGSIPVEDATVEVFVDDARVAALAPSDSGTYVGPATTLLPGQRLTLRVAAPEAAPVEGTDTVPIAPPIADFADQRTASAASRRVVRQLGLTLDDPADSAQQYGLFIAQLRVEETRSTGQFKLLDPTVFPFESDEPAFGNALLRLLDDDTPTYRGAFFTDEHFDGQRHTLDLRLQYDLPNPANDVVIHRAFALVVLSASDHFYRYWQTANEQLVSGASPFSEPLRVHSNMDNGVGIFAGVQYRILPLDLDATTPADLDLPDWCTALPTDVVPTFALCSSSSM
ncbi:MAG: DUF4249 domain-containing protein [Bacteroidota bacterium]